jgi:hypothetical protein
MSALFCPPPLNPPSRSDLLILASQSRSLCTRCQAQQPHAVRIPPMLCPPLPSPTSPLPTMCAHRLLSSTPPPMSQQNVGTPHRRLFWWERHAQGMGATARCRLACAPPPLWTHPCLALSSSITSKLLSQVRCLHTKKLSPLFVLHYILQVSKCTTLPPD